MVSLWSGTKKPCSVKGYLQVQKKSAQVSLINIIFASLNIEIHQTLSQYCLLF